MTHFHHVNNIDIVNFIQVMLLDVGAEHTGHTGIKTGTQKCHQPGLLEAVVIGPLPLVFELRLILGLVIRGVEVVRASFKAH